MEFWQGKRVFITGHTGFKGSWLCLLMHRMGATVAGYSKGLVSDPSLFQQATLSSVLAKDIEGDVSDSEHLSRSIQEFDPDVIFHLAAQSLVRESYRDPRETFMTNIVGTMNVFEASKKLKKKCVLINVTSDKCYENKEWIWSYRENEPMGGDDPYSCSKACSELITTSYRKSFFNESSNIRLASARAGNVIGGGDWSKDRLIPDIVRASQTGTTLTIRNPDSVRPWQHVLDALSGYMTLAEKIYQHGFEFCQGWNFGPRGASSLTVAQVLDLFKKLLPTPLEVKIIADPAMKESKTLNLDSTKAHKLLGWQPVLSIEECLRLTAEWYNAATKSERAQDITTQQIEFFLKKSATDTL